MPSLLESSAPLSPLRALALGGVVAGTLDIVEVSIFAWLRAGVPPLRVLQSVASGWLGRAAYQGGVPTAVLGLATHFFIAFTVVAAFFLVSSRVPSLLRSPFVYGPLYGVLVYLVMSELVVPMSAAATGQRSAAGVINGILIHAFGIGLPAAIFARRSWSALPARGHQALAGAE